MVNLVAQKPTEDVFSAITPTTLNAALTKLMPGLSAKVFRTYNASIVLETELKALDIGASKEEKVRDASGCHFPPSDTLPHSPHHHVSPFTSVSFLLEPFPRQLLFAPTPFMTECGVQSCQP